jgi:hypothetical protein
MPLVTEEGCHTFTDPEIVSWDNPLHNEKEIIPPDQVVQERTVDASDLDNLHNQHSITKMCGAHLMEIFCDEHLDDLISYLAMEYAKIRHHFEQRRLNNVLFAKSNAKVK